MQTDTLITAAAVFAVILALWFIERQLGRRHRREPTRHKERARFWIQLLVSLVVVVGGMAMILTLGEEQKELRGQLIQFYGILLTAAIALASTTLLGNALAGVMLRLLRGFRPGDVIRAGKHVGMVTQRGLLNTEIQLEASSDLTRIPNLHLVTNPFTITRSSGTVVSATVSLGYEVDRRLVEQLLKEAAREAGLKTPVVHVENLGDFSVVYRVLGKLEKIELLLTARSELREQMLDALHGGGVEIVSPTFMNTRRLGVDVAILPETDGTIEDDEDDEDDEEPEVRAEDLLLDKGREVRAVEEEKQTTSQQIEDLRARLKAVDDPELQARLEAQLERLRTEQDELKEREAELSDDE